MRRRPPHLIELTPADAAHLAHLVHDGRTEQRIARRARILLAMADPATVVEALAERLEVARSGIWELCRRYEERGLDAVLDAPRSGRPRRLSPPAAHRDRALGVLRAVRRGVAHDPLVDALARARRA
jgi:hypothetical protein